MCVNTLPLFSRAGSLCANYNSTFVALFKLEYYCILTMAISIFILKALLLIHFTWINRKCIFTINQNRFITYNIKTKVLLYDILCYREYFQCQSMKIFFVFSELSYATFNIISNCLISFFKKGKKRKHICIHKDVAEKMEPVVLHMLQLLRKSN